MPDGFLKSCLSRARHIPLLFLLLIPAAVSAVDVASLPAPTGYLNDFAHVVEASDKQELERYCGEVERQLGVQFALVTVDTIGDTPIENFTLDLARKWGVGIKKDNQGVLLLLAIKDRKTRIEVGRGVEPYLPDGFDGGTLRAMRTPLRAGNYGDALQQGARAMATQIAQGKNLPFSEAPPRVERQQRRGNGGGIPLPLIVFGIIFLLVLVFGRRGGGRGGNSGGSGMGGFLTGMLLNSMLSGGGRRGGGGIWGGGGGFGGNSGGSGGFGGFGGGDFGGGGASSDW